MRRRTSSQIYQFGAAGSEEFPLFPTVEGWRPSKAQMVAAWSAILGCPVRGHSPRRSGAKARARTGWSVWMIQFFGRWASATVLEYIEEALAQCTANWKPSTTGPASPSSLLPGLPMAERTLALPWGSGGELEPLSERASKAEARIEELSSRLDAGLTELRDSVAIAPDEMGVLSGSKFHYLPQGGLELPRPLWATACGWRFGTSLGAAVSIMSVSKVGAVQHSVCDRCAKRRAFGI